MRLWQTQDRENLQVELSHLTKEKDGLRRELGNTQQLSQQLQTSKNRLILELKERISAVNDR